jgi:hypothetical protein
VNVFDPLDNKVPPVAAEYQSIASPEPGVAESATVPAPQREALPAVGAVGAGFTVTETL